LLDQDPGHLEELRRIFVVQDHWHAILEAKLLRDIVKRPSVDAIA
jgi:hypothetical protein